VVSRDFRGAVADGLDPAGAAPHRYAADQKESDLMVQLAREALHDARAGDKRGGHPAAPARQLPADPWPGKAGDASWQVPV
jgi:hypothetical protein